MAVATCKKLDGVSVHAFPQTNVGDFLFVRRPKSRSAHFQIVVILEYEINFITSVYCLNYEKQLCLLGSKTGVSVSSTGVLRRRRGSILHYALLWLSNLSHVDCAVELMI